MSMARSVPDVFEGDSWQLVNEIGFGDLVELWTTRPEVNSRTWTFVCQDESKSERCIVEDADNQKRISVKWDVVRPAGRPRLLSTREWQRDAVPASLEDRSMPASVPAERCESLRLARPPIIGLDGARAYPVGQWIDLPFEGGNQVRLMPRGAGDERVLTCMYPALAGFAIEFRSTIWGAGMGTITLQDCDYLDLCPYDQIWPRCPYCKLGCFLLGHDRTDPAGTHRRSKEHANKCRPWRSATDPDACMRYILHYKDNGGLVRRALGLPAPSRGSMIIEC